MRIPSNSLRRAAVTTICCERGVSLQVQMTFHTLKFIDQIRTFCYEPTFSEEGRPSDKRSSSRTFWRWLWTGFIDSFCTVWVFWNFQSQILLDLRASISADLKVLLLAFKPHDRHLPILKYHPSS
ncbi:hypothetical protein Gasu2_47020 [Galdieria sulphuraria]|nr:hypothetical protein Gasu2_47020 [Galdieria sulphuraria]